MAIRTAGYRTPIISHQMIMLCVSFCKCVSGGLCTQRQTQTNKQTMLAFPFSYSNSLAFSSSLLLLLSSPSPSPSLSLSFLSRASLIRLYGLCRAQRRQRTTTTATYVPEETIRIVSHMQSSCPSAPFKIVHLNIKYFVLQYSYTTLEVVHKTQ